MTQRRNPTLKETALAVGFVVRHPIQTARLALHLTLGVMTRNHTLEDQHIIHNYISTQPLKAAAVASRLIRSNICYRLGLS